MKKAWFALFAILALCSCILSGCSDTSSSDEDGSGSSSNKIILHAYNYVNVYVWGSSNSNLDERHFHLQSEGDGWYTTTLEASYTSLFFTTKWDSFMEQTEDSYRTAGEWWYKEGTWYYYNPSGGSSSGGNGESGDNSGNEGGSGGGGESDDSGLYLGIISFGDEVSDLNNDKLMLLNSGANKDYAKQLLADKYKVSSDTSTLLYYGVHKALINLENNATSLPKNLENVYIITFTDGLDTGSAGHMEDYPLEDTGLGEYFTTASYAKWLNRQLNERTIKGNKIACYALGVPGSDVRDNKGFETALENITTPLGKSQKMNEFSEVQEEFKNVAESLTVTTYNYKFTLRLPTNTWQNDEIIMTFDIPESQKEFADVNDSKVYFHGKVERFSISDYTFSIDKCVRIVPSSLSVPGKKFSLGDGKAAKLEFVFENIGCEDPEDASSIQNWLETTLEWYPSNGIWQTESEYLPTDSPSSNTTKSSAAIYLVLDNSTSIARDLPTIKNAVSNFIDILYSKLPNSKL